MPKYAFVGKDEVILEEAIFHADGAQSICIFQDANGHRRYVSETEWLKSAQKFADYAKDSNIVTSESSNESKLALFRSLFKGRSNVYAHGYTNKQGGIGYTPACANERTRACPRWVGAIKGLKCSDCGVRKFMSMDDSALIRHFRGEVADSTDVLGMYVLTQDCKTWVLVADFDDEGWQRATTLYRDACVRAGLCPAVERSRSGNGAHVWIFFDEAIDAALARNLGCTLISDAMASNFGIGFDAYDRLFPTQTTIAEGGFGNLIALPFQGAAQRHGNTVFVDESFNPYPDQWRYLSAIARATENQVSAIVNAAADGPLGQLAFTDDAPHALPQEDSLLSSMAIHEAPHSAEDRFPPSVKVVKRGMLLVKKDGLSAAVLNKVRRIAAFGNPEFYRAQAMHQSVYGKPRIVWCGEEDEQYIMLPRGCEQKLVELFRLNGCACTFEDERMRTQPIRADFAGKLRARQQEAADDLLRHENGVLSAPTGFGKTVIGAYLIGELKMKTLIIVPQTALIGQWKDRLEQFLSIEDDRPPLLTKSGKPSKKHRPLIGQIGGGKNSPSGIVDIATFQSLVSKNEFGIPQVKPIVGEYECVICDECHHGAAPQLELIMKKVNARRVYGLSATPKRADGLESIIFMHCGPIRHKVDPKERAADQGIRRVLHPCFTRVRLGALEPGASFNQVLDALCKHEARNRIIVKDVVSAVRAGRFPLVITKRKDHAAALAKMLKEDGIEVSLLTGSGTTREKRERLEQVRNSKQTNSAIVATGSYVGEGFDLPRLDTLMLAAPYSWEGVITQYSGRLHRAFDGKNEVIVYDYVDTSVPMLERMYKRRLKAYAKLGYEAGKSVDTAGPSAQIFGHEVWQSAFIADLEHAAKSVLVSAPYANPKLVKALVPALAGVVARGVPVTILLRRPKSLASQSMQEETSRLLETDGCTVDVRDDVQTGIALFDEHIAWYGTLPLLAYAHSDDCALRVESAEVAVDLQKLF